MNLGLQIFLAGFVLVGLLAIWKGFEIQSDTHVKMTEYEKEEGMY